MACKASLTICCCCPVLTVALPTTANLLSVCLSSHEPAFFSCSRQYMKRIAWCGAVYISCGLHAVELQMDACFVAQSHLLISFIAPSSFATQVRGLRGVQILNVPIGCINHTLTSITASILVALQSKAMVTRRKMLGNVDAPVIAKARKAGYGRPSTIAWQTSPAACHACTSRTAPFLGSSLKAARPMTRFQVSTHIL